MSDKTTTELTAGRDDTADDATSQAPNRLSAELVDALAHGARAVMRPPPQRPVAYPPEVYELLVRREIRRAIARGDSRRRVVRNIARASTLTTEQVAELVDRELAEVTTAPRGDSVRPAPRPKPPVPPWARERRRRGSRPPSQR